MLTIHTFLTEAECELSGRTGEAVEISAVDGSIRHAVISLRELAKLLRFRHRQEEKKSQQERSIAQTPALI